jgi:hypothetical protein
VIGIQAASEYCFPRHQEIAMRFASLVFITLFAGAVPAFADAIDGDWCSQSGSHFKITGPSIELGAAAPITGDYSRHAFRYASPAGEPDAGSEIQMILQGEHLLHLRRGSGPVEEWRRCSTVS